MLQFELKRILEDCGRAKFAVEEHNGLHDHCVEARPASFSEGLSLSFQKTLTCLQSISTTIGGCLLKVKAHELVLHGAIFSKDWKNFLRLLPFGSIESLDAEKLCAPAQTNSQTMWSYNKRPTDICRTSICCASKAREPTTLRCWQSDRTVTHRLAD